MSDQHEGTVIHPTDDDLAGHAIDVQDGLVPDPAVSAHLAGCPRCTTVHAELRDLASGRLPGESRPLSETLDADLSMVWSYPADDVWSRISSTLREGEGVPLTSVPPAQVAGAPAPRPAGPALVRRSLPWLAAAAALVLGISLGREMATGPQEEVQRVAQLRTVDPAAVPRGQAQLVRTGENLAVRVVPDSIPDGEGYLELWLINADGTRMVSIGVMDGQDRRDYQVTQELIDQGYTIVDISREPYDDKPEHSGDSLARGALDA